LLWRVADGLPETLEIPDNPETPGDEHRYGAEGTEARDLRRAKRGGNPQASAFEPVLRLQANAFSFPLSPVIVALKIPLDRLPANLIESFPMKGLKVTRQE